MQNKFLLPNLANKALIDDAVSIDGFLPSTNSTTRVTVSSHQSVASTTYRCSPELLLSGTGLEVVSSAAADTALGTHARTVQIKGVLSNGLKSTVTVSLNGTVAVPVPDTWIGVTDFRVLTSGTQDQPNSGDITLRVAGAGQRCAIITASFGYAQHGIYTVPANRYLYLHSAIVKHIGSYSSVTRVRLSTATLSNPMWNAIWHSHPSQNNDISMPLNLIIPPLTMVEWSAFMVSAATNVAIHAVATGWLLDKTEIIS